MNTVRLGDIAELKTGPFGTQLSAKEYVANGVPVINVKNIGYGNIIANELDYISQETCNRLAEHILQPGDIVFGRKGSVDRHAYIDEEHAGWFQGSDCIRVRANQGINSHYLSHYLKLNHIKKMVNNAAVGSTMASLNTDILKDIIVELPDIKVQDKIEMLLSSIDEKIENNEKINDNLYQQIQLLFDFWFMQFNFPDVTNNPYSTSSNQMVWNDEIKMLIPPNWNVCSLHELCTLKNGINYDKNDPGDTQYKIINVRNISSSTWLLDGEQFDSIWLNQSQAEKYIATKEDIIIARSGTPGATRVLLGDYDKLIFCGFIICCTPIDAEYKNYIALYLKKLEGTSATKTGGSILQNVSQETISSIKMCLPPKETIRKFNICVNKINDIIITKTKETSNLLNMRDWLLPMLMNGQATIDD